MKVADCLLLLTGDFITSVLLFSEKNSSLEKAHSRHVLLSSLDENSTEKGTI